MRSWLAVVIALSACDQGKKPPPPAPPQPPALPKYAPPPTPVAPIAADLAEYTQNLPGQGDKLVATISTSQGTLTCELFGDKAPMAVANFVGLATGQKPWRNPATGNVERGAHFYDGLTFHRVIAGFMIQGGDPLGKGMGGPGYTFDNEIWQGAHIHAGSLAMANAGTRDSGGTNGSQFFIMEGSERADLDTGYTLFGECGELDVVKKIARVKTDAQDKPLEPVSIRKVTIAKSS